MIPAHQTLSIFPQSRAPSANSPQTRPLAASPAALLAHRWAIHPKRHRPTRAPIAIHPSPPSNPVLTPSIPTPPPPPPPSTPPPPSQKPPSKPHTLNNSVNIASPHP